MKEEEPFSRRLTGGARIRCRSYAVTCLMLLSCFLPCGGECTSPVPKRGNGTSAGILFRIGDSMLDVNYRKNRSVLDTFMSRLNKVLSDTDYTVSELKITGAASPDGKRERDNILLAGRRAESLRRYVLSHSRLSPSVIKMENKGENWEALREMVAASDMRYKNEVLRILDSVPERNKRKDKLMFLHHSVPYLYMYRTFFPVLRSGMGSAVDDSTGGNATGSSSGLSLSYKLTDSASKRIEKLRSDSLKQPAITPVPISASASESESVFASASSSASGNHSTRAADKPADRPQITNQTNILDVRPGAWTIGTNLAYDGILLPNIELQSALSRRMSIAIEGMCAWWCSDKAHKYYQIAGLSPELRYWGGRQVLQGHYLGALLMGGLYDLENGGKGFQGEYLAAGISFGYAVKVGGCFMLDFGIAAGALMTQYRKYDPEGGKYVYRYTDRKAYFGPLKAKVELVWRPWKKIKKEKEVRK